MITITIRTENAAFQGPDRDYELRHILERVRRRVGNGLEGPILDSNGNRIGEVILTGKDREQP